MAGYRQIHTQIWKDEWFIELEPEEKLLFIYLFSNDLASISGLYKIPVRVIVNETGLERKRVDEILNKFCEAGKIQYEDGCIWVVNMSKYHQNASPKTQKRVQNDVDTIPDYPIKQRYIQYATGDDTVSIPYPYQSALTKSKLNLTKTESKRNEKPPDFPPSLNTPVFLEVWNNWIEYRKETKHKLTPSTIKSQLKMLEKFGSNIGSEMINQSIQNGWQGIFELRANGNNGKSIEPSIVYKEVE